ncbi:MAG TPA: AbrB/MazE/SpoVT family DNA-binding domain-containing protein [Thermomicrobiaceae bacterium]|nr:AbrB/MazE/SpoVT family DNA-binding domain-containing protein [Thermomicrobiaceae bacterium]
MKEHLSVITRKGQVTIPAEIRRALDLKEGDTVAWVQQGDEVRITPARFTLESAFGSVAPSRQPEDFEALTEAAKEAKARATADEICQA